MKPFKYGLVNRPAGFATLPSGLAYSVEPRPALGEAHHETARHGVLIPERPLTSAEMLSFEIAILVDDADLEAYALELVESQLAEYAGEYLQSSEDDRELFARGVLDLACRRKDRVMCSIGDADRLVQEVIAALKARCAACA